MDSTLETVSELELSSMDPQINIPILDVRLELLSPVHTTPPTRGVKSSPPHPAVASQEPGPSASAPGLSTSAGVKRIPPIHSSSYLYLQEQPDDAPSLT